MKIKQKHDASTPVQTAQINNNEAVDTAHTAENSLDWDGKYKGTLRFFVQTVKASKLN